jgi:hypothetical protein
MFPQLSEELLHERVREYHRMAEASRRARLARRARRAAAAATPARPMAVLRSLTTAGKAHTPATHADEHAPRRAA